MIDPVADRLAAQIPPDCPPFALAFSGGGDSHALLTHLRNHPSLSAVIHVDHGLRENSHKEADYAAHLARNLGHELVVLLWNSEGTITAIQEKARSARYRLMGQACRARNIQYLVTAHHANDQAETVLMRLQRNSGWRGVAGMKAVTYAPVWPALAGVTLLRPALAIGRKDLRRVICKSESIRDPSNYDETFARVRVRRELGKTSGLREEMLALSHQMETGLEEERLQIEADLHGHHLTHEGLFTVPRLLRTATLAKLAPIIGGQSGPVDRKRLRAKRSDMRMGRVIAIGSGCMAQWDGEMLTLSRDPVAMTGRRNGQQPATATRETLSETPLIWDGRFLIRAESGIIQPERRGYHVGFRIHYGQNVRMENLVAQRLQALLTGM